MPLLEFLTSFITLFEDPLWNWIGGSFCLVVSGSLAYAIGKRFDYHGSSGFVLWLFTAFIIYIFFAIIIKTVTWILSIPWWIWLISIGGLLLFAYIIIIFIKKSLEPEPVKSELCSDDILKSLPIDLSLFSAAHLEQIRLGLESGLSNRQVLLYAKPEIDFMDMWDIREKLLFVVDVPHLLEQYRPDILLDYPAKYTGWTATLGAVYGDIAGSRYEFNSCDRAGITLERAISTHSRFTDDTVLTMATLDAVRDIHTDYELKKLLKTDIFDVHAIDEAFPFGDTAYSRSYRKYYDLYPSAGYGPGFHNWALAGKGPYRSYGNGSAMRVAPIGEAFDSVDDVITHAIASAACTHNHPEGIKGAIVTAVCIWMSRHGYAKGDILVYVKKHYENQDMIREYTMNELRRCDQKGYAVACQFSVPAAITCFAESSTFEECIENALSFVGDSDTIAAIAGSLAAAFYGSVSENIKTVVLEKLPETFLKDLFSKDD